MKLGLCLCLFKHIAYSGSWKHFVFVFVCVCVSLPLYLSFCKYSSRSLLSPDDKLSVNIWSKTWYDGDKWRCDHGDNQPESENNVSQQIDKGLLDCWLLQFTSSLYKVDIVTIYNWTVDISPLCTSVYQQYLREWCAPRPLVRSRKLGGT